MASYTLKYRGTQIMHAATLLLLLLPLPHFPCISEHQDRICMASSGPTPDLWEPSLLGVETETDRYPLTVSLWSWHQG